MHRPSDIEPSHPKYEELLAHAEPEEDYDARTLNQLIKGAQLRGEDPVAALKGLVGERNWEELRSILLQLRSKGRLDFDGEL